MSHLHLFEGYGIELEYALVDENSLAIRPLTDDLLTRAAGKLVSDFVDGAITWSNELVMHVIEFKTSGPATKLAGLEREFKRSIDKAQRLLTGSGLKLMPTAMHPFMKPDEMVLWPHDSGEIYAAYNRIFGCKGHGWSNVQSMHINLPFADDDEFERLHSAIRFLLPVMPALTASSPVVEGKLTGSCDSRLGFYEMNQRRVPIIAGQIIPEHAASMRDYHENILAKLYRDIAPHDPDQLLREDWLNSRGAIARFERQSIEIRVLDTQESPTVDIAIAAFVCSTLQELTGGGLVEPKVQRSFSTSSLKDIFDRAARDAEKASVSDAAYAAAWGLPQTTTAGELWQKIFANADVRQRLSPPQQKTIAELLKVGSLATRIVNALGGDTSSRAICDVYARLCTSLKKYELFMP